MNWMSELYHHHKKMRDKYPNEKLMIMFDIDGTIIDMRYSIIYTLKLYDRKNKTSFFNKLKISDVNVHENNIENLLTNLKLPFKYKTLISKWYHDNLWSQNVIINSHKPYKGILQIISWFLNQPNTHISLNTGRPEILRIETLTSLYRLTKNYCFEFSSDKLFMNRNNWEIGVINSKINGYFNYRRRGYKIISFIDNEPVNLEALSYIIDKKETLLLHAQTIYTSKSSLSNIGFISGNTYDFKSMFAVAV